MEKIALVLFILAFLHFFGSGNILDKCKSVFWFVAAMLALLSETRSGENPPVSLAVIAATFYLFLFAVHILFAETTESLKLEDFDDFDD